MRRSLAKSSALPCASACRSIASSSDRTTAGVMRIIETLRSAKVRRTTDGCRLVGYTTDAPARSTVQNPASCSNMCESGMKDSRRCFGPIGKICVAACAFERMLR